MMMENVNLKQDDHQDDKPGVASKKIFVPKSATILFWQDAWPKARMISSLFLGQSSWVARRPD